MTKRQYLWITVALLIPSVYIGSLIGHPISLWLVSVGPSDVHGLLTVLGYLIGVLLGVIAAAIVLLPLRIRAGIGNGLSDSFKAARERGLREVFTAERASWRRKGTSSDPRDRTSYHGMFALIAGLLGLGMAALNIGLWIDGWISLTAVTAVIVTPVFAVYHGVQWIFWSRKVPKN